jgi:hypothetical protein
MTGIEVDGSSSDLHHMQLIIRTICAVLFVGCGGRRVYSRCPAQKSKKIVSDPDLIKITTPDYSVKHVFSTADVTAIFGGLTQGDVLYNHRPLDHQHRR